MARHTEIPTRAQIDRLLAVREQACVSIYLPTTPLPQDAPADRIELKNLTSRGLEQLREADTPKHEVAAIEEELGALIEDEDFWFRQAASLAVFVTPTDLRTFRLPNRLTATVQVSDRFHIKPLLRAVTFPQAAYILALAQGSVRLLEITADAPAVEVHVPDLPVSAAEAAGKASITDRAAIGGLQGSEGQKVRMRQYARKIDQALRPVLNGQDLPLILAATAPLDAIFRTLNSYPHLAAQEIAGNPEDRSADELAAAARTILDAVYAEQLAELTRLFEERSSRGRSAIDLTDIARAATFGAVDTLFVDIDAVVPGLVDEDSGVITAGDDDAEDYGVVDEIARRVLLSDGRVLAVRADDVPEGGAAAAILRYPV